MRGRCAVVLALLLLQGGLSAGAPQPEVSVTIDTGTPRHRINPAIYGVNFGSAAVLRDLNVPLNRSGGNSASLYNWRSDARGAGADWYFESLPVTPAVTDQFNGGFVDLTRAGGAAPMLTIPIIGWTARLGPGRAPLAAYSVRKYGPQRHTDPYLPDAGDGMTGAGTPLSGTDPRDAALPAGPEEARARVSDLVARYGAARSGGVPYYILDNEPSLWHQTHRSVHPLGAHARDVAARVIATSAAIKAVDPFAAVVAPEEWGWSGYFDSGFDQQGRAQHRPAAESDRVRETAGMDYLPFLLSRWRAAGHPVDVVSVHFYPQGGEYVERGAGSPDLQRLRNESTRLLWDPAYREKSWIGVPVALIPRLRKWVDTYYWPGTPIAITEYSWGGDESMSGAVAQADLWGIFGREGLDMAARWTAPRPDSPVYRAMRLIRNYDGRGAAFGDLSMAVTGDMPDELAVFAARRQADRALTLLVINKRLDADVSLRLRLTGNGQTGEATRYRLTAQGLAPPVPRPIADDMIRDVVPRQSISLYVIAAHDS